VVVNNSVTNIAFDGVGSIAGRCGLTKNGSGTLTIATQNTYTGETHINAGMVILAAGGALGASAVKLGDTTDSADAALLIAGPFTVDRPITVQDDGSPSSSRTLGGTNTAGTAVFSGGITVAKDLMLTAAPGGDVRLAGALDNSAGRKVTKIGDGAVTVAGSQMHGVGAALVVSGGTVNLDSDAGSSSIFNLAVSATGASTANLGATQHLARLALAGGAKANLVAGHDKVLVAKALGIEEVGGVPTSLLDLADNDMVVQHAEGASDSTGAIRSWIASGYNGRKWDGNGIVSTSAADNASTYGLGYAQNGTLVNPFTTFDGQPVDSTSILVKYTYLGDLNLDGKVDDNDVTMLVLNYGTGWKPGRPAGPAYWQDGDVAKYDGKIDDNDVTALVLNYGAGWKPGMGGPLGGISAAVPEPATLALLALGGLAVLQRRRR
jgi:autotransporter-associated beta strand protein